MKMVEPKTAHDEKDEELGLKKLVEEVTEHNRVIDDAYDEKMKRLEDKKKLVPNEQEEEKHQAKIEALKEKLEEIKNKISEARKSGKDPFIADLLLRNVNAKIKMAKVTHEDKDYRIVENILNEVELELEEALKTEELDVKKEIITKLRKEVAKETGKVIDV